MGINVRQKGQRAERDAIKLLQPVIDRVYCLYGYEPPFLERNQQQTNRGGYDIIGLEWIALEIKHQEKLQVEQWWQQALRQTKNGQTTVLMYKRNNVSWRVRLRGSVGNTICTVEVDTQDFLNWFEERLHYLLQWQMAGEQNGTV